jgi:hypothetical protein
LIEQADTLQAFEGQGPVVRLEALENPRQCGRCPSRPANTRSAAVARPINRGRWNTRVIAVSLRRARVGLRAASRRQGRHRAAAHLLLRLPPLRCNADSRGGLDRCALADIGAAPAITETSRIRMRRIMTARAAAIT